MTRAEFDQAICRLSLLRGAPDDGEEHFVALQDLPAGVFDAAVTHALKTRIFFPVPAELRVDADIATEAVYQSPEPQYVRPDTAEPRTIRNPFTGILHTIHVDKEWRYDCDYCSDLGMETFWCGRATERRNPWTEFRTCDRRFEHASHEWVAPCGCVDTNPTIRRRREAQRVKYAEKAGKA